MSDTSELRKIAIEREIDRQWDGQREELKEAILQGCEETDSLENICAKMVINGIEVATKIAAVMAMELLFDAGVCQPKSDDQLRRELFSVVNDGKDGRLGKACEDSIKGTR